MNSLVLNEIRLLLIEKAVLPDPDNFHQYPIQQEEGDPYPICEGERGGRFTNDVTADGRPYRRYF